MRIKTTSPHLLYNSSQFHENTSNLTNFQEILTPQKKTSNYGLETVNYRALSFWAIFTSEYKNATCSNEFHTEIKTWKSDICPCKLRKDYALNKGCI